MLQLILVFDGKINESFRLKNASSLSYKTSVSKLVHFQDGIALLGNL